MPDTPIRRISQSDIARKAGVHVTTVSLALRNSPRLPSRTRTKIQNLAKDMGYSPDPMLTALSSYRKTSRLPHHQGTLAWINSNKSGMKWANCEEYRLGAKERCEELGYTLEEFFRSEHPSDRLAKILLARNIQGLLFPPQLRQAAHIKFDWRHFSPATFGFSLVRPKLHLITNAQYVSSQIAVKNMRKRGYRRIGFASARTHEVRTNHLFSSGYLAEQRHLTSREQIPPLIYDDVHSPDRKGYLSNFADWVERHKLDSVLSLDNTAIHAMGKLGIRHDQCGLAALDIESPSSEISGIYQNNKVIGRTAVDFVVGMIQRNERGIPGTPLQVLVNGIWVEGSTLPQKNSSFAGEKS